MNIPIISCREWKSNSELARIILTGWWCRWRVSVFSRPSCAPAAPASCLSISGGTVYWIKSLAQNSLRAMCRPCSLKRRRHEWMNGQASTQGMALYTFEEMQELEPFPLKSTNSHEPAKCVAFWILNEHLIRLGLESGNNFPQFFCKGKWQ